MFRSAVFAPVRRTSFLLSVLVAAACVAAALSTSAAVAADTKPSRPNILFIYTDDQSHRTVSCYPEALDWVHTPNIDRLASQGVRFASAYIGTWCMPSRATLLTGLHQYGVESMRMEGPYPGSEYDPEKCPFWPAGFRRQGYVTAQIGKWHTGTDTGAGRDWDYQVVWNRPRHTNNAGSYYGRQMIEINGGPAEMVDGYSTDNYTRWAVDFIRGEHRDPEKPWYLWLCYGAVHGPYTPAQRHREAHPGVKAPTPEDIYPPRPGKPEWAQRIEQWVPGPEGEPVDKRPSSSNRPGRTLSSWVRQYQQTVLALDEAVGTLMEVLEETGQRENTLVVFTSDQGFAWGQHGFKMKLAGYDSNLRAPLIISQPGTYPTNQVCETPVGGHDLIPTFYRAAGLDLPWEMHGRDLTPLLQNPQAEWPHPVLIAHTARTYGSETAQIPPRNLNSGVPWYAMLRDGRFKYIRSFVEGEIEELYDLQEDPEELRNLAEQPGHGARVAAMRAATVEELRRTNAPFVDSLPPVGTKTQD